MRRLYVVFVMLFIVAVHSQSPTVTFGRTVARVGNLAQFSDDAGRGYTTKLGDQLTIGGVVHQVQHVVYNDASDEQLIAILYDRLINVDKVDFLFSPLGFGMKAIQIAEDSGVPIMNCGAFDIFFSPTTSWNWVTTVLSPLKNLYSSCEAPLYAAGARTMGIAIVPGFVPAASFLFGNFTLLDPVQPIPLEDFNDDAALDKVVKKWKALSPDIFVSSGNADQMNRLINRVRKNRYEPKAIHIVAGAATEQFSRVATWKAGNILVTSDFQPQLNYSDSLFGNSQLYDNLLVELFNSTSSTSDAYYAQAGTILIESIKAAGTKDRAAVMQKIRSFNGTTISGPTSFDPNTGFLQRGYFCFQFDDFGKAKYPVYPLNLPGVQKLAYPADSVRYAKGFFPKNKKQLIAIIVPVLGGALLLIAALLLVGYLVLRHKYHLVFVPKQGAANEEWT